MSINRMYYGTKKIYSFLENGNQGGECNCEQEYQNGYDQGYQDGLANCTGGECTLGTGSITLTMADVGRYELNASDDGYDGWSTFIVELEADNNVKVWDAQYIVDEVKNGSTEFINSRCLIKGQITSIKEINIEYGNATYNIGDFQVYRGKDEYGNAFVDADRLQVGDYVVVEGIVTMYNDTVQFSAGSELEAIFRCEGGSTEGGSNPFTELGWSDDDVINMLQDVDDYAIRKMQEWDASSDSLNGYFREDPYDSRAERLMFAPMLDTSNVINFGLMFYGCKCLVGVPKYNTSNATFLAEMFGDCHSIKSIPDFDTINVNDFTNCFKSCSVLTDGPNWDFGNAVSVRDLFAFCNSLTTIPRYNFSNVSDIGEFFGYYGDEAPNLVNLGGFEGLKIDWNDGNGLDRCPNITYESIMNVINDLYDFRGNGDNDTTRTLKINTNTMALLSDEDKQIAINKGWMLTE